VPGDGKDFAGVAQLVEHLICNQRVRGSNPFASSSKHETGNPRRVAERQGVVTVAARAPQEIALLQEAFRNAVVRRGTVLAPSAFPSALADVHRWPSG
jgi:hypothetical protein